MGFVIVTDSASNLIDKQLAQYDIHMIAYEGHLNGEVYSCHKDGEDDVAEGKHFYKAMREGAEVSTSLINPARCTEEFEKYLKNGQDVIFIGMSSGLSGTYQSACLAAEALREEYPDRKCIVVDSMGASLGEGIFAIAMSEMRSAGKSIEEAEAYVKENRLKMRHIFTVDDLKYLRKGGRISAAAAMIGSVLNLKPMLYATNEAKIGLSSTVRGRKRALEAVIKDFEEHVKEPEKQIIGIAHCDCEEDANYIANRIREKYQVRDLIMNYYDRCTGAHVGPGALALFFMGEGRD